MTPKEFIDIYMPLHDAVYRVAYCLLESQQDAEDAVQDLYIKLWNSRDSLDAVRSPRPYCLTLMRNICIDRIRKASKAASTELHENIPDNFDTGNAAIGKETMKMARQAIEGLPEGQRKVLRMKIFEEMSNEEISSATGMSNLTVRVLLSQARKTLKKKLL